MRRISVGVKKMAELRGPGSAYAGPCGGPRSEARNPLKRLGWSRWARWAGWKIHSMGLGTHGRVADRCTPSAVKSLREIQRGPPGPLGPPLKSLGFSDAPTWTERGPHLDHPRSVAQPYHAACRIMASKGPSQGGPAAGGADRERTRFAEFFEMGQPE